MAVEDITYMLRVNAFEAGLLMGVIMQDEELIKHTLANVWKQLVEMKKEIEEAEGVKKEVLPGGMLQITDNDGNIIIRRPYPWEIEGN
ncbi:hypothetical protein E3J84_04455, partial [Candidatus Aerophobetes bacterium]